MPALTRAQNNPATIALPGGSFESPTYTASPFYGFQPTNSEWTWSGFAGVQRNGSGLGAAGAPDGAQTAFLQGSGSAGSQGAFSQNVTLTAGVYKVSFKAAQRATGAAVPIQIKMDGTALGAPITPASTSFATYASAPFRVSGSGGTYRLGFSNNSNSGISMSLIDSIVVEVAQPVVSGGFEAPVTSSYGYAPANSGWTWSGFAGIQHNGSLGANAPEGVQTAFLQGASNPGSFSQVINLSAGSYKVVFKAAQRPNIASTPIQVRIDGNPIGSPITPSNSAFTSYSSSSFTVGAGNHTLGFSTTSAGGGFYSLIDDVTIESNTTPTVALPAPLAPRAPVNLSAVRQGNQVNLSWYSVGGATGYKMKRSATSGGPYTTFPDAVTSTAFYDRGIDAGTSYYYRVFAFNAANYGDDSEEVLSLGTPVVKATAGSNQVVLRWNSIAGATSYSVTGSSSAGGSPAFSVPVSGTTATSTGLAIGTDYYYDVTAWSAKSGNTTAQIRVLTLPGDIPSIGASAISSQNQVELLWDPAGPAANTSYRVMRATVAGGPYTTLPQTVSSTSFSDTGLARTTYYYRVYAFNSSGNGPASREVSVTLIAAPSAPTLTATGSASTSTTALANLNWKAVSGADYYKIERSESNADYVFLKYVASNNFTDSGLNYGTTYNYRVYACNEGGFSVPSNVASVTVSQPAPTPTPIPTVCADAGANCRSNTNSHRSSDTGANCSSDTGANCGSDTGANCGSDTGANCGSDACADARANGCTDTSADGYAAACGSLSANRFYRYRS